MSKLITYASIWCFLLVCTVSLNGIKDATANTNAGKSETGCLPPLPEYETICPYHTTVFYKGACVECATIKESPKSYCNASMADVGRGGWNFGYISYQSSFPLGMAMTPSDTTSSVAVCPISQVGTSLKRSRDGMEAIKHKVVNVVTVQRAPFSKVSGDHYSGVMFDVLRALQSKYNFSMNVSLPPDGNFGSVERDRSGGQHWNGMVGQVLAKEADIGASSFSITLERFEVVDFSVAIHQEPTAILIPAPTAGDKLTILIRPFEPEVWASLFVTIFLLAPVFYIFHKISLNFSLDTEKGPSKSFTKMIAEIFMFITGSLVQESVISPIHRTRFLVAIWWMITLVLSNTYVGFLVSFLSAPKLYNSVDSLEGLLQQNALKWTFRKGTAHHNLFKSEGSAGIFKQIGDGVTDSELAITDADGVTKALTGNYAFIKEKSFLEFALGQDFESVKHCRLTLAKQEFFTVGIAFIVPKQSPILPLLDAEISYMIATGLMEKWKQINWPQDLWCVDAATYIISTQPHSRKLNLGDFQGVSFLWICGLTSALLGFVLEHVWRLLSRFRRPTEISVRLQFTI